MRDLVRQIVENYKSPKLEGQEEGYVVFSGQEPDSQQPVSIKILPRVLGQDPEIAKRFEALSRAIRQLNHPNIVAVRKMAAESGLPYMVTRTIEKGQNLAARLSQPWPVDAAADVVMQAGQALEHAYNKGVVHGSLSPDNILVQDQGRILVAGFGLSELLEMVGARSQAEDSPYLAPERLAGKPADARTDVYSLGAILYRLLAGRAPQVVRGQVLPPSRFNPDVPQAMDQVAIRALAPAPQDRYPDVKAFVAALGAVALAPAVQKVTAERTVTNCPRCGAKNQTGRFCRKCGYRLQRETGAPPPLAQSKLDEPIQITRIEVGQMEIGAGVEVHDTTIAQAMTVASGDVADQFPDPLPMPQLDARGLWPTASEGSLLAMPEPPSMPVIDWAEIAPPMPEVPVIEDAAIVGEQH
jgi:serine/threonine protein kinase